MESRVKTWESIAEKLERKSLELQDIDDLHDLVGIRLILLFRRDVAAVSEVIKKTFSVVSMEDVSQRLDATTFGYQSIHFVLRLPKEWLKIPSFHGFDELCAEVQVRTLAQHIWAATSHKLQYKQEQSVPIPVRRSIHRVSALLETIDLEFERVLDERASYLAKPGTSVGEAPLNVDVLQQILTEMLPPENRTENELYAAVLEDLLHFGVDSASKLRTLVSKHLEAVRKEDASRVQEEKQTITPGVLKDRLDRGVFYSHVGLVRRIANHEFGAPFRNYRLSKLRGRRVSLKAKTRARPKKKMLRLKRR